MPLAVTRLDSGRFLVVVRGALDASELLTQLRRTAAQFSGTFLIDVNRADVSPVALAKLKGSELWSRMSLWGLTHTGQQLVRHLAAATDA